MFALSLVFGLLVRKVEELSKFELKVLQEFKKAAKVLKVFEQFTLFELVDN